ncbi:NAD-dependent epimerase/dehydratase family protein [Oscillospiraceae bacterium 21-37]
MDLLENQAYINSLKGIQGLEFLRGKTVLISGATGMLGSCLADAVMVWNWQQAEPCRMVAVGRNLEKARERFELFWNNKNFIFIQQDVCKPFENFSAQVDFIIHAASPADPVNMAKYPADTLLANVLGTKNLLEYGLAQGMERFLFVSSGEVYGQPDENQDDFVEGYCGVLDLSSPRSCYPEGKRAAEVLCQSYRSQFGADVVIVRPCHLFGPTMSRKDSRAVAEFLWAAAEGRDIVLKSDGLKERSHCYVIDAVQGLLFALEKGESGQAYNIADRRYQMTIRAFAEQAAEAGGFRVVFDLPSDMESRGYSRVSRQVLCADRLESLGWQPAHSIQEGIPETIKILRECAYE